MTTSWTDYLLCQLTSDKRLSTLECLAPEILEPILEELHERSIGGLRAFSQVSRTCRALASPYRFKPLRVKLGELVKADFPDVLHSMTVTLSYRDGFKTLKMHGLSCADFPKTPGIEYLLKAEQFFECLEFLPAAKWVTDSYNISNPILEVFNRNCPSLSRIVIGLGPFHGYSPGWDREYRESVAVRRRLPVRCISVQLSVGQSIVRTLAGFQTLSHLTVHFTIEQDETALMHPVQGQHAVREMYHGIEKLKEGVRLSQLDVAFSTCWTNIFGRASQRHASVKVQFAISRQHFQRNRKGHKYVVTCDESRYGKIIERRQEAVKLYGPRAWEDYLGPYTWELSEGIYLRPAGMIIDLAIRLALLPSILKPTEIKKAGRRGIFCA